MAENVVAQPIKRVIDPGIQVIHALSQLLFQGRSQRSVTGYGQRAYKRKPWVPYSQWKRNQGFKRYSKRGSYRKSYRKKYKKRYNRY